MREIIDKVDEILKSGPPSRHTYFQLNFFVIGKEPTTQAKIHRCLEEMKSKRSSLVALRMEIEEMADKYELLELEKNRIPPYCDDAEKEIIRRQIARKMKATENHIKELKSQVCYIGEELQFFLQAYEQLIAIEPRKDWDDQMVQLDFWNAKLGAEIRSKLILQQPIDTELIKTVMALPDSAPIKKQVIELIEQGKKALANRSK